MRRSSCTFPLSPISRRDTGHAIFHSNAKPIEWFIQMWSRTLLAAAGIRLRAENVELLDPNQRYILIANHYSYFDIPCIFVAIPQPIRFMAKASLFRIPIFGWALGRAGFIPIDRKNRRTAVKSFDMAGQRIRKGNSICVFPEEGRSRERKMRPFQRGAFLLALKSELPIVPLSPWAVMSTTGPSESRKGKFQGAMTPMTPFGSYRIVARAEPNRFGSTKRSSSAIHRGSCSMTYMACPTTLSTSVR